MQQDLVSTAQLATEWGCTRRNINASLRRWGVKRYAGERVSRAEAEAKRAQLSSPAQAENSARAWKRSVPPPEQPLAGGKSKADAERIRAWIKAEGDRLDLEERKKTLLNRDEVAQAWGDMISAARNILLQLGAKLAPRLADGMSAAEREALINAEVRRALIALSEDREDEPRAESGP
jgi:hypothetical protein